MLIFYTILTFVCYCFAIIIGYHNSIEGLNPEFWPDVIRDLPVFKTAIVIAILPVLNCIIAYYVSEGKYEKYKQALLVLMVTVPGVVQMILLPQVLDPRNDLVLNGYPLFILGILPQWVITPVIAKRMWERGGRSTDA